MRISLPGDDSKGEGYSQFFIDHFIIHMDSAIWSIGVHQMMEFPLAAFACFYHNHALLTVNDQLQWYVIASGSNSYVKKKTAQFEEERIRLSTPVGMVRRKQEKVIVVTDTGSDMGISAPRKKLCQPCNSKRFTTIRA